MCYSFVLIHWTISCLFFNVMSTYINFYSCYVWIWLCIYTKGNRSIFSEFFLWARINCGAIELFFCISFHEQILLSDGQTVFNFFSSYPMPASTFALAVGSWKVTKIIDPTSLCSDKCCNFCLLNFCFLLNVYINIFFKLFHMV